MCFKYVSTDQTWGNAVALCNMEESELPLPQNEQENTDLHNYFDSIDLTRRVFKLMLGSIESVSI